MLTLEDIIEQIEYTMRIPDLAAKTKKWEIPLWRGMYCKIAVDRTPHSLAEIGQRVNLKYPTVIHWRDTFENLFLTRPDIEARYRLVLRQLRAKSIQNKAVRALEQEAEDVVKSMLI